MPRATTCILDGAEIDIDEALQLRDLAKHDGRPRPLFRCGSCQEPVRSHRASGYGAAHFEHLERNPQCSQSDPSR
jgi:hypothetical protein